MWKVFRSGRRREITGVEPWSTGVFTGGTGTATAFFERIHIIGAKGQDTKFHYQLRRVVYGFSGQPPVQ